MTAEQKIDNPNLQEAFDRNKITWETVMTRGHEDESEQEIPCLLVTLPSKEQSLQCDRCRQTVQLTYGQSEYPMGDTGVIVRFENARVRIIASECASSKLYDKAVLEGKGLWLEDIPDEELEQMSAGCILANNPTIMEEDELRRNTLFFVMDRLRTSNVKVETPTELKKLIGVGAVEEAV